MAAALSPRPPHDLVNVGSLSITKEALIVASGGVFAALVIFGIAVFSSNPVARIAFIATSLASLALGLYASYATNCVIVGDCNVLAWVYVGMFSINFLVYTMTALSLNRKMSAVVAPSR